MVNESGSSMNPIEQDSQAGATGPTANVGHSATMSGGAAKVFREFKWGLLTLFLLMVVVVGLVYDGGRMKKNPDSDLKTPSPSTGLEYSLDAGSDTKSTSVAAGDALTAAPGPALDSLLVGTTFQTSDNSRAPIIESVTPPPIPSPTSATSLYIADGKNGADMTSAGLTGSGLGNSSTPDPKLAVAPPAQDRVYVVKAGDSLTHIASAMLPGKGGMKAIVEANKDILSNPNKLRVGMTLKIPNASSASLVSNTPKTAEVVVKKNEPDSARATPAPGTAVSSSEYVVQSGDTLERIARKLFNDGRKWREVYEWNREQLSDPSRLRAGQTLKIKQGSTEKASVTLPVTGSARVETDVAHPEIMPATLTVNSTGAHSRVMAEDKQGESIEVMSRSYAVDLP